MIRDLSVLKYTKAGFAVLFGILLLIFLNLVIDLVLSKIKFRQKKIDALEDIPTIREMNRMKEAVSKFNREITSKTWFYTAGACLSLILLLAGAMFHKAVIEKIGIELFIGSSLLLLVLALLCILLRANFKENACMYLGEYIYTLCHIHPDFHECIRLILSPKYTSVVFGDVIAAIYRSVQEISDIDMLFAAGRIMHSDILLKTAEKTKEKMCDGRFYSKYYIDSFAEVKDESKNDSIRSLRTANIIGFAVSFVCLFSLCLTL